MVTTYSEPDTIDLTVITKRYYDDAVHDGEAEYHHEETELVRDLTTGEAIDLIRNYGLTFEATGGQWAADPDGDQIIDYRTAEHEEVTVHFASPEHVPGYLMAAVIAGVDSREALSAATIASRNHAFLH